MLNNARSRLLNLNLYDSQSADPLVHRNEIQSTRLFLLLLFSSILILTAYASFILRIKSETIAQPSLDQYNQLEILYPNTLSCTCTKLSIFHNDFVTLRPVFHQVCSSNYIAQSWIDFTYGKNRTTLWPMDVRTSQSFMWQLIAALCHQSQLVVGISVEDFHLTSLVSSALFSRQLLYIKMQAAIRQLRQLASDRLARPLMTIHHMSLINDFLTGISTNHIVSAASSENADVLNLPSVVSTRYLRKNSKKICHCQNEGSCPVIGGLYLFDSWETQGFYDLNTIVADHIIPGLIVDCLPMQMVFASTLECFYNRSCVDLLISSYSSTYDIAILDENVPSRFPLNTTIDILIKDLFIEILINETNFTAYYAGCAPMFCTYTYARRFDWFYATTMITTLFGGLNLILKLIAPYFIQLVEHIKRDNATQQNDSRRRRLNRLYQQALESVRELNLFTKESRNPLRIRRGRISSRLFLIVFVTTVVIFIIYTFLSMQIFHETIRSPTKEQYLDLYSRYGDILDCPCSTISMPYQDIIELQPTYHQLCTTSYTQAWFYQYLDIYADTFDVYGTFSVLAMSMRALNSFCELTSRMTAESIRSFYATSFMNSHVISEERFYRETEILVSSLQNSTKNEFFYTMKLIKSVLQANQYISGTAFQNSALFVMHSSLLSISAENTYHIISVDIGSSQSDDPPCYCARHGLCNKNISETFFRICSLIYFILLNSWSVLYGDVTLKEFRQQFLRWNITFPSNVTIPDPNLPSRFPLNVPFQTIVDELTIENWNPTSSFQKFYETCRPILCSFTYQGRPSFLLIISVTIGIIGGLNKLLKLACPFIVRIFVRTTANSHLPNRYSLRALTHQLWDYIVNLNVFDSESDVVQTKRMEKLSTCVYIILMSITLSGFTIYAVWDTGIAVSRISLSSIADYDKLENSTLYNLRCPCSQISVSFKYFTSITTTFHQVCSSDFVQDPWIDFLFANSYWFIYQRSDIRVRGAAYFAFLSSLCSFSKTVVERSIEQLLNETFINSYLISEADFRSKTNLILDSFIKQTPLSFASTLELINSVTHGNSFVSTYFFNWDWEPLNSQSVHQIAAHPVILDDDCSCATRRDCRTPSGVLVLHDNISLFTIPGFFISCSSVNTLMGSTLECFYDQQCLDALILAMTFLFESNGSVNVHPLDPALASRFPNDALLKYLIENLMVEEWQTSASYKSFYDQCAPSYCTHMIQIHDSLLTVFTRVLGFYGGLVSAFRIAIPFIIKVINNMRIRRRRTVTTYSN